MSELNFLQMCEGIQHGSHKIQYFFFLKILFFLLTVLQKLLQISDCLLHLNVPFFPIALVDLFNTVTANELDNVRVWFSSQFIK